MGRFVEKSSASNVVVIRQQQQQQQQQQSSRISFPVESPDVGSPSPHILAGQFPSVSLLKQYQNAAMAVDCSLLSHMSITPIDGSLCGLYGSPDHTY